MARDFLKYPFAAYQGGYSSKPFNSGRGQQKGLMVALDIPWATYQANGSPLGNLNPNFVVDANLNGAGPNSVSQMWNIESVYIDNEGVDFPVYVYFTDSLFTVSCPANSAGWYQVFTNARHALIAGVGINDAAISGTQRTRLFFTDVMMVPSLDQEIQSSVDLWRGSNSVQRFGPVALSSGLGSPALGDQIVTAGLNITAPAAPTVIGKLGPQSGFIYFTQIQVSLTEFVAGANIPATTLVQFSGSIDGILFGVTASGGFQQTYASGPPTIIRDIRGNLRFSANQTWALIISNTSNCIAGTEDWTFVYTVSDK